MILHRWILFRPPFFGFLFDEDIIATDRSTVSREMFLHPPSGLVGNKCRMDCEDADDIDVAHVIGETQLAIGFRPPVAGVIEVLIDAQCTVGSHSINIEDESGFSEAWCNQHNFLMMNVLHPNVPQSSMAQMSSFSLESGGDDVSGGQSTLVPGQHYYAQLFSTGPVPAGQHVVITLAHAASISASRTTWSSIAPPTSAGSSARWRCASRRRGAVLGRNELQFAMTMWR